MIAALALVPALVELYDNLDPLLEQVQVAQSGKSEAQNKFDSALKKHKALPTLEGELAKRQEEIVVASEKLPDALHMDQILQKIELIAQELGVSLRIFDPGEEIPSETAFKYLELPVKLEMVGSYGQITGFFDRISHLELIVQIRNFNMRLAPHRDTLKSSRFTGEQMQRQRRAAAKLAASCDLVLFRSLTKGESEAVQVAIDKRKAKKKKRPGK